MMNTKRKVMRSTQQQLTKMVDYMSNSKDFANGEYAGPLGKRLHLQEWETLQKMLNDAGPAKTVDQWKITWRDMKKRARDEGARVRAARAETGNLPVPDLSSQSSEILKIIGTECAFGIGDNETGVGELVACQLDPEQHLHSTAETSVFDLTVSYPLPTSTNQIFSPARLSNPPPTSTNQIFSRAQPSNPSPTSTSQIFSPAQLSNSPTTSTNQLCGSAQLFYLPPTSTNQLFSSAQLSCPSPTSTTTPTFSPAQVAYPPPSTNQQTQAAWTPATSHITSRRSRVKNPGPRDYHDQEQSKIEVLKDISNTSEERNKLEALKIRRDHQARLRAARYRFSF